MENLQFFPLYDRLIVRPADTSGRTKSGLFIPEIAKANKLIGRGEVIAVGAGRVTMEGRIAPLMCKVGDLAIYARQQGQPIPWGPDEEEVLVLREPDVLGVYRADTSLAAFVRHLNSTAPDDPEHDEETELPLYDEPHPALPGES